MYIWYMIYMYIIYHNIHMFDLRNNNVYTSTFSYTFICIQTFWYLHTNIFYTFSTHFLHIYLLKTPFDLRYLNIYTHISISTLTSIPLSTHQHFYTFICIQISKYQYLHSYLCIYLLKPPFDLRDLTIYTHVYYYRMCSLTIECVLLL